MKPADPIHATVDHLFRHEAGKITAVLARFMGPAHWDDAEDIVQDTLAKALDVWKIKGLPQNPTGWLMSVARHRAIDVMRAAKTVRHLAEKMPASEETKTDEPLLDGDIEDSVLRLMFACCHPGLPEESQLAFVLKTLGGLSVAEIAQAFRVNEDTVAKRIYRAKEKLRELPIDFEAPLTRDLGPRLDHVIKALYVLFNEGYYSAHPQYSIRTDLCWEAMRLATVLARHPETAQPAVHALLAMMCLHASRFPARANHRDEWVLLEDQDRSQWDKTLIQRGMEYLERSSQGEALTEYHIEAAIASVHALSPDFASTPWTTLVRLYDLLYAVKPDPMVALNKAIAIGYGESAAAGVAALEAIGTLKDSPYYFTALGMFYRAGGHEVKAQEAFANAWTRARSDREREVIGRRRG